ncbi:NACHT domain-containing protein [Lentzea pudingi]|uniref:NACHT domain-containing protein n=1 Tax=Lentzea pudingi TaxID=1789439 RepID=UPI0016675D55|nr:NACHT domain-containing protein [Lentzea pudingi]
MSVEAVALGAGRSVAKLVFGRWMAGHAAKTAATMDLVDLIKTGFPDEIKRRKAERQFEAIADSVTERLLAVSGQEFRGLSDGDREAVLHQVILTLDRAELTDRALFSDDLDPIKLARRLRVTLPGTQVATQLGEAAARLYDVILDECCDCLARAIIHLPQFEPRAVAESLVRLSRLAETVETMLSRLPIRSLVAPEGTSGDDEFTRRYLESISDSLDQVELLGVRFERLTRTQTTLSVAYISLSVSAESHGRSTGIDPARGLDRNFDEIESASVRVERALGDHRLMLVRGEAGGGKSTLLRWLAVTASRRNFEGALYDLNGCVPLMIKLRSHAEGALPRPEEFLDDIAGSLTGIMPRGWVHRHLLSGRAIVLVDGVDEVIASQRQLVRVWIKEIITQFPRVRMVVTSRPAAAAANWLKAEGFTSAFLEQLGMSDLRALVRQWHLAIRGCAGLPCSPERLPAYEAKLLARLDSAPHLRTLAATPLLAAMLCALNLDRESLPRNRMSLYGAALEMLLETRDSTCNVPSARLGFLESDQKIRILQDLSWHLSTSGRVELPKATVERLIADRLTVMPQVRSSAAQVLDLLVHRSGVLREPVPGRIDFVHRTIQEYLSAKHAADIGDMDLLIRNAHQSLWRETVIMAAGHANEPLRRELVAGILDRAKVEPRLARRLKLLAVACLETLPSVSSDVSIALSSCLDDLVPPRDSSAARSLSTAGEAVLGRLPRSLSGLSRSAAEATIQVASYINGEEALDVLANYAAEAKYQSEISRAWEYFEPDVYAKRVLAAMPEGGRVHVLRSQSRIAALRHVPPLAELEIHADLLRDFDFLARHAQTLRDLSLYVEGMGADLHDLPEMPQLSSLALRLRTLTDLSFMDGLPDLRMVWLTSCESIENYGSLKRFANLETLALFGSLGLRDLGQLPTLASIKSLSLEGSKLSRGSLEALANQASSVTNLYLGSCDWLDNLDPLSDLSLQDFRIFGCSAVEDLSPLAEQQDLRFLEISKTGVSDLSPVAGLKNLRILRLRGCARVVDLTPLADLPNLRELLIEGIADDVDLNPLRENRKVSVQVAPGQLVRNSQALGARLTVSPWGSRRFR